MHRKLNSLLSQTSQKKIVSQSNSSILPDDQLTQLHIQLLRLVESRTKDFDILRLVETIKALSKNLDRAAQSELNLGIKSRIIERQQTNYKQIELKHELMKKKNEDLEQRNKDLIAKIEEMRYQQQQTYHQFQLQQKQSEDLQHKVQNLESRLEIVLESDFASDSTNIRKTLTDLVKENERQKRDLQLKSQEIQRLQEQLKSSHLKISKLNAKVEVMKKKISVRELENIQFDKKLEIVEQDEQQNDPTMILSRFQPCDNLDFRVNALKLEYAEIISDIVEQGASIFSQKLMAQNLKQMKEQIQFVTAQFLSYKDFAEKLNNLFKIFLKLELIEDLQERMTYIEDNAKNVFMCQYSRLWVLDAQMGIFYTNNNQRALTCKGAFSEAMKFQKPINKRDYALLFGSTDKADVYINQCICYPLFNSNNTICGLLEMSNSVSDFFSFDEEYYGVLLAKFCEQQLRNLIKDRLLRVNVTFHNMLEEAFTGMINCNSLYELYKQIRYWIETILTVSSIAFYFVQGDKFVTYQTTGFSSDGVQKQNQNISGKALQRELTYARQGIAGMVSQRGKQLIVMNMKKALEYDETIDIDSLLPVLIHPIILDGKVICVFEVPIKQRTLIKKEKDKMMLSSSSLVGLDESFEMMADKHENIKIFMIEDGEISSENCHICGSKSKYKCPACEIRTCSLKCCQQHKKEFNCNGKRDQTKYIRNITSMDVQRDFTFLDETMKESETIQKKLIGITALPDAMRYKLLKHYARKQSIDLVLAPKIMYKHRQNISFYSIKDKQIYWCLELKYFNNILVTKPYPQNTIIKDVIQEQNLFSTTILEKYQTNLDKTHIEQYFDDSRIKLSWETYEVTQYSEQDEYKFKNQKKRTQQYNGQQRIKVNIDCSHTIYQVIKGYTVFEFPSINLEIH